MNEELCECGHIAEVHETISPWRCIQVYRRPDGSLDTDHGDSPIPYFDAWVGPLAELAKENS